MRSHERVAQQLSKLTSIRSISDPNHIASTSLNKVTGIDISAACSYAKLTEPQRAFIWYLFTHDYVSLQSLRFEVFNLAHRMAAHNGWSNSLLVSGMAKLVITEVTQSSICEACNGTGTQHQRDCTPCKGTGRRNIRDAGRAAELELTLHAYRRTWAARYQRIHGVVLSWRDDALEKIGSRLD